MDLSATAPSSRLSADQIQVREFIDALREWMGKDPLYQSNEEKNATSRKCKQRNRRLEEAATAAPEIEAKKIVDDAKTKSMKIGPEYNAWKYLRASHRERMHEAWRDDFRVFLSDIGSRPSDDHSLERIDGERYEPGNVRWAIVDRHARAARIRYATESHASAE